VTACQSEVEPLMAMMHVDEIEIDELALSERT
jgi:hypothetical protein